MPSTLPHSMTWIAVIWKWKFALLSRWFQLPPSPDVGLQPGFTLPPKLILGPFSASVVFVMVLIFAPPPVSQQPSARQCSGSFTDQFRSFVMSVVSSTAAAGACNVAPAPRTGMIHTSLPATELLGQMT